MIRDPSALLQRAIRDRLISTSYVTDFVPADRIIESGTRPEKFPTIQFGYDETVLESWNERMRVVTVTKHVHIWTLEDGVSLACEIADAISRALVDGGMVMR